jgi:hypothetical protein
MATIDKRRHGALAYDTRLMDAFDQVPGRRAAAS